MRLWALIPTLVLVTLSAVRADRPAVVALSSMTGVTVKLTDQAGCRPGSGLSYAIRHLPDGTMLASGAVRADEISTDAWGLHTFSVNELKPRLWSPQTPELYELTVTDEDGRRLGNVRFGFRTFEARDDKLYLNGTPVFLRGFPINAPNRELPAATERDPQFIRGYLNLLKSAHVNAIRVDPQDWLDKCDELGMMVFTGRYGPCPGGKGPVAPPVDPALPVYRDLVLNLASHPSVVIYILTNEVDYKSPNSTNRQFLTAIHSDIRAVDPTRPIIGNAGFGHGQPGEIFDLHAYMGWYNGSFCDWYRVYSQYYAEAAKASQPLTFTECVGAYTSDAGDFLTMSKQLCTMTKWIGTAKDPHKAALEYQAELVRQIVEIGRRYRSNDGSVAGIMPFTYFLGWTRAQKANDLVIKPAFDALKTVYQPVLLSPECWRRNLYAGDYLKVRLCVSNDDDKGRDLGPSTAYVEVIDGKGAKVASKKVYLPKTPYYSNNWGFVSIALPKTLARGRCDVRCRLICGGSEISRNSFQIFVAPRSWVRPVRRKVTLYDPSGSTAHALRTLGMGFTSIPSLAALPESGVVVIGEGALASGRYPSKETIISFLNRGGRMLCLAQRIEDWNTDWLPARFKMHKRSYTYIQPVGGNAAIMNGVTDRDLRIWNEIDRLPNGTPDIYPAAGALYPESAGDLRHARVWASCDQLLGAAALLEISHGSGSVILSQFSMVSRAKDDPIAAKLLANLISYVASATRPTPIDLTKPVHWDHEAFRSGVFMSPLQGFLPHSKTYKHEGSSKGLLGADHRIDGFTLVGNYGFTSNGWLRPVPDPKTEGWGILYGTISRAASRFVLKLHNTGNTPASISLKLDGQTIGSPIPVQPGAEQTLEWVVDREAGPVELELRGDQRLVITESCFR